MDGEAARCRVSVAEFIDRWCRIEERHDPGIAARNILTAGTDGASTPRPSPQASTGRKGKGIDIGTGGAIPFRLWPGQRDALASIAESQRSIVLKARQLGLTWLVLAYALWVCLYRRNSLCVVYSLGKEEAVEAIDRARFLYDHLPPWVKRFGVVPSLTRDRRGELGFANGSILRAKAATQRAGRSFTATLVIMDEMAFQHWGKLVLNAAERTIEAGGQLIVISTANGVGDTFQKLWQRAASGESDYRAIFLPWQARPGRDQDWYDRQVRNAEDPSLVPQEYPANAREAFLTSGKVRFQPGWIAAQERYRTTPIPMAAWPARLRRLLLHDDPHRLSPRTRDKGRWTGLALWVPPKPNRRLVLGADVAEGSEGGVFDAAVLIDADTKEEIATLRGKWELDEYADLLCEIALAYGATLAVERNNHGHAILTAIRLRQKRYREEVDDAVRARFETPRIALGLDGKPGWLTDKTSKPQMISLIAVGLRDSVLTLHSPALLDELAEYRKLEGGKTGPPENGTADLVMGLGVALAWIHLRPKRGRPIAGGRDPNMRVA